MPFFWLDIADTRTEFINGEVFGKKWYEEKVTIYLYSIQLYIHIHIRPEYYIIGSIRICLKVPEIDQTSPLLRTSNLKLRTNLSLSNFERASIIALYNFPVDNVHTRFLFEHNFFFHSGVKYTNVLKFFRWIREYIILFIIILFSRCAPLLVFLHEIICILCKFFGGNISPFWQPTQLTTTER